MNPIQTIEHNGCKIKIFVDPDPQNPLEYQDASCCFISDMFQHATLDDDFLSSDANDMHLHAEVFYTFRVLFKGNRRQIDSIHILEQENAWERTRNHAGIIYCAKNVYNDEQHARRGADSIISEFNNFLSGECYGFEVLDELGNDIDSCWGFLGDLEYAIEQAKEAIDDFVRVEKEKRKENFIFEDTGAGYLNIKHKDMLFCAYDDGSIGLEVFYPENEIAETVIDPDVWPMLLKEIQIWQKKNKIQ